MFERFTDRARRVLVLAQQEARRLDHGFIGDEHILLGLLEEGRGVAAKALEALGVSLEAARDKVDEAVGTAGTRDVASPPFTPRAKKVLELAFAEALALGHGYIGTEHLLLGLVRQGEDEPSLPGPDGEREDGEREDVAVAVLVSLGADPGRVRRRVLGLVSGHPV